MIIFDKYIKKHAVNQPFINENPEKDLQNIIVIPCYNEPAIIPTLNSLISCKEPENSVEVIIVINSADNTDIEILEQNRRTKSEIDNRLVSFKSNKLKFHTIWIENIPNKFAGVGFARKVGMDEAIRRFSSTSNANGIITGFDADSLVSENYLVEIENLFLNKPKLNGCSIYFEHPIKGTEFPDIIYRKITEYELYLRYYSLALKQTDFPYYFHTVGSSFSVKAETYCKQGGMNRRKAGEDFYFLQKIMPLGNYVYLNTTTVFPSSRPSDRVPFGTGAFIKSNIENPDKEFVTYNFEVFRNLNEFFKQIDKLFNTPFKYNNISIHESLLEFLKKNEFAKALAEINENTSNINSFKKRFFQWFDAFRVLKYMNFAHENYYQKITIKEAVNEYLNHFGKEHLYSKNVSELLKNLRQIEKAL
ncbi:MAG: glycosyltransferase family 2 protein [Bacteroidota bacterium]